MSLIQCQIFSRSLAKATNVNVLLPQDAAETESLPVLYLLHGLSDDATNWFRRTSLERYADANNIAVVLPDGGTSWYCNQANGQNYYDYIAQELPRFIQRTFRLDADPKKRFIAGLSMGGYGAVKIALRNPGQYAACAGFSGAYHPEWVRTAHNAIYREDFQVFPWRSEDDPYQLVESFEKPETLPLYLACGRKDGLLPLSTRLRDLALAHGFQVTWDEADYNHEWPFWDYEIAKAIPWMLSRCGK